MLELRVSCCITDYYCVTRVVSNITDIVSTFFCYCLLQILWFYVIVDAVGNKGYI